MGVLKSSGHAEFGDRLSAIMATSTTRDFRCPLQDSIIVLSWLISFHFLNDLSGCRADNSIQPPIAVGTAFAIPSQ
jgi:hypothetical protein